MGTRFFVSYALRTPAVRIPYAVCTHVVRNGGCRTTCVRQPYETHHGRTTITHAYDIFWPCPYGGRTRFLCPRTTCVRVLSYVSRFCRTHDFVVRFVVRILYAFVRIIVVRRHVGHLDMGHAGNSVRHAYRQRTKYVQQAYEVRTTL